MLIRLPPSVRSLRLDPMSAPGRFRLESFSIEPVNQVAAASRLLSPILRRVRREPSALLDYVRTGQKVARESGFREAIRQLLRQPVVGPAAEDYDAWIRKFDSIGRADVRAIQEHIASFKYRPVISIVVPAFNTPEAVLRRCIESVRDQLYPDWELCLADDASSATDVAGICERYARNEPRIKFVRRQSRGHIAEASNSALALASGEFVALLDHDDELAPHALYMVAHALNRNRELDLVFSDEDKIDARGRRFEPWFKSDWNYDLMLSQNAVVHLAVFRRSLLQEIGGFRSGFDGSQDYDLILRYIERTSADRIEHLPFILYHWRAIAGSVALDTSQKSYPYEAAVRAIQEHLDRRGTGATVRRAAHDGYYRASWPIPADPPCVTIVIPTKDKLALLETAVESILTKTTYRPFRIVIINNGSELDETKAYLSALSLRPNVSVLDYPGPFSFAAINNWAVGHVETPLIAFVNNDIEVIAAEWLTEMVGLALRPNVGAVGAKLIYPDGTIQHAGIVVGLGGLAGHPHVRCARATLGYFGRAACIQQYSAVSAGCMVMRKEAFDAVGGFDETNFAVAFNDVDIGLRLREAGYSVVWTPYAELVHHESATLGLPSGSVRRARFEKECANLRRRWAAVIADDPFYNPNLTLEGGDFSLSFPPRVERPWLRKEAD